MGFWKFVLMLVPCLFLWWFTKDYWVGILLFMALMIFKMLNDWIAEEYL